MDIRFINTSGSGWHAECAIITVFEDQVPEESAQALWHTAPWLAISPALRDFTGTSGETILLYGHPDTPVSRVMIVGLGKKDKATCNNYRNAIASAVKLCKTKKYKGIALCMENIANTAAFLHISEESAAAESIVAAKLGLYSYDTYKQKKDENKQIPAWLGLLLSSPETPDHIQLAIRTAEAEADGVLFARDLVNAPANFMSPTILADAATEMAKDYQFTCQVLDQNRVKELGMGALYAVGKGSKEESRFIILEHCPKGKEKNDPFIIVGKGITFDSGGISIKPAANMHEMKGDMAGAAAVFGFFKALGNSPEKDDFPRIIGLIPAAENMPGGFAIRPGDVVTTLSGKTVEILNTDAEGRLILCDALTYAQQNWKPKFLINIATLTGACVVALGDDASGLFTDNRELRSTVMDVAEELGELFWPLPMWDAYDENLKSDVADFANMGSRMGGALHAALFLRRFIEKETRWAHLDIAGPGYVVKPTPTHPVAGGTGEGVRLFYRLAKKLK